MRGALLFCYGATVIHAYRGIMDVYPRIMSVCIKASALVSLEMCIAVHFIGSISRLERTYIDTDKPVLLYTGIYVYIMYCTTGFTHT